MNTFFQKQTLTTIALFIIFLLNVPSIHAQQIKHTAPVTLSKTETLQFESKQPEPTDTKLKFRSKKIANHNFDSLKVYFQEAYAMYPQLPKGLLESISYNTTRLKHRIPDESAPNCMGNANFYGVMGLILDGKGITLNTMQEVSEASGYSIEVLKNSPQANIIGTAAWLNNMVNTTGIAKSDLKNWLPAIHKYIGFTEHDETSNMLRDMFVHQILTSMKNGVELNGYKFTEPIYILDLSDYFDDQFLKMIDGGKAIIEVEEDAPLKSGNQSPDYAAAEWFGSNCYNSRNGTPITDVVIHDMEGYFIYTTYTLFQNCSNSVSAHYCIRSSDGFIVQLVSEANRAWHIGNANSYAIGIEHEGFANDASWYTDAMYRASADLVKDITQSGYGISPTRCYNGSSNPPNQIDPQPSSVKIKGHCHYPSSINPNHHWDPGPNWNWQYYYSLINGGSNNNPPNLKTRSDNLEVNGTSVSISVTVQNDGSTTSGTCRLGYYAFSTADLNTYFLIGTDNLPSLSAGERETKNRTIDLCDKNLPNGTYYVGYYIDDLGEISESDETDNGFWYWDNTPIVISSSACGGGGLPNLKKRADNLNVNGTNLSFSVTVENNGGTESERCRLGYYASSSSDFSNPVLIARDNISSLSPSERGTENATVDLCDENLTNGTYYVGYYIDDLGEISESDETDNGFWYWDNTPIEFDINNCPLPIEMLTPLQAQVKNKTILLRWQTATETNNAGFEIQKSSNGRDWEKISWQEGQGNSPTPLSYTYTDTNPLNGTSYYRLRQVDFDGNFSYSDVVDVNYTSEGIVLYPNPVKNTLHIVGLDNQRIQQLILFAINGKIVRTFEYPSGSINVSDIPQGIYMIEAIINNGIFYEKIIVEE